MKVEEGHLFFWGGVFSQWTKTQFNDGLHRFNCCEQFMMHRKAMIFDDYESMKKILAAHDPREQKRLGRRVKNFDPEVWDEHKLEIVTNGNRYRANACEYFSAQLIKSDSLVLVKASPYDRIWGVGYDAKNALANKHNWGQNLLGQALMTVRKELLDDIARRAS